jgi:hypothetical protein
MMTQPFFANDPTNLSDLRSTRSTRTETKNGRIERIIVDLPTLPPHSTGCFTFTLKVHEKFGAAAVEDSSCRIHVKGHPEVVAIPFATQIRSADWFWSLPESIGAAFSGFGGWVSRGFKETVQERFKELTVNSRFHSCAGLDVLTIQNGVIFAPTGFNRVLVVGPSRMVVAGGGNLVAAGGLNLVAAGGGNAISVKNVPGFGTLNASAMVAAIPRLVAAGGGNLVAAGGGNLIGLDGSTLIGNDGSTLIGLDGSTLVGIRNGRLIGNDGSTFATITSNGGSLTFTPVSGASIRVDFDASKLVAAGGGNTIAVGGGSLVAAGGGNLVDTGGGDLVAAGGGNLVNNGGLNAEVSKK